MARLTSIATQLSTILAGLTTANGYSFDFGSINEADPALQSFPSAIITYTDEVNAFGRGEGLSYYSYADAEFQIKVRCELSVTEGAPLHAIDAEYDTVVSAMKRLLQSLAFCRLILRPLFRIEVFAKRTISGEMRFPLVRL
jgi:hypothetical protein